MFWVKSEEIGHLSQNQPWSCGDNGNCLCCMPRCGLKLIVFELMPIVFSRMFIWKKFGFTNVIQKTFIKITYILHCFLYGIFFGILVNFLVFLAFFHLSTTFTLLYFDPRHLFAPCNVRFIRLNAKYSSKVEILICLNSLLITYLHWHFLTLLLFQLYLDISDILRSNIFHPLLL